MILLADSGSTKTDWCFSDGTNQKEFTTSGANPFFRGTDDMIEEWKNSPVSQLQGKVSDIFFYAAGVVNAEKAKVIKLALQFFFPEAEISVKTDLLAAAQATLGNEDGIACILGTGSNSCRYNGKEITAHVPPLGFILGDEGSGAVLGRQLVADFLKKIMPEEIRQLFQSRYQIEYGDFLNSVYRHEKPNMFLAGFVPFLKENIQHEYCTFLVNNAFDLFITRNVAQYEEYQIQTVSFAGSVAWYFQKQIKAVFIKRRLHLGKIVKDPLLHLLKYHLKQKSE
jgi:glucosamine kinase